jgi:lipopolysaccharide transport system ATP-binding protein
VSDKAITVEGLSKRYDLGSINSGTLTNDLKFAWAKIRGRENPNSIIGEKSKSGEYWALNDVSFEIKKGESVGIIGKNGAGKSTLLKILSRVTAPTKGKIKVKGRIASLLEVGTGFHPDLTGRENIFMNGAILGMTRHEIAIKLDEIIAFSGVEKYIDTPVKRYSSGMYVRLAFAVAAHLESEILIVDEVLAVGDAEFQKKCLGKMNDVSSQDGRTVLFVSHNMGAVKELCNKGVLLSKGKMELFGNVASVLSHYLLEPTRGFSATDFLNDSATRRGNGEVRFSNIKINGGNAIIDPFDDIEIQLTAAVLQPVSQLYFTLIVNSPNGSNDFVASTGLICLSETSLKPGQVVEFTSIINANTFRTGLFPLYLWLGRKGELAEDNYPFDLVDAHFNLNIQSSRSTIELGYNSEMPVSFFNLKHTTNKIIK